MELKYIQFEDHKSLFYFFNTETYELLLVESDRDVRLPGYAIKIVPAVIDYLNKYLLFNFKVSFDNLTVLDLTKIIQNNQIKIIKIKDEQIILETKYSVLDRFLIKKFLLQLYFESTTNEQEIK